MELVQNLMKNASKYLFYSTQTEKVLTECPCRFPYFVFYCEAQGKGKGQVIQKSLKLDINSIQSAV